MSISQNRIVWAGIFVLLVGVVFVMQKLQTHVRADLGDSCTIYDDCGAGLGCVDGICRYVCETDAQCPNDWACSGGTCLYGCGGDGHGGSYGVLCPTEEGCSTYGAYLDIPGGSYQTPSGCAAECDAPSVCQIPENSDGWYHCMTYYNNFGSCCGDGVRSPSEECDGSYACDEVSCTCPDRGNSCFSCAERCRCTYGQDPSDQEELRSCMYQCNTDFGPDTPTGMCTNNCSNTEGGNPDLAMCPDGLTCCVGTCFVGEPLTDPECVGATQATKPTCFTYYCPDTGEGGTTPSGPGGGNGTGDIGDVGDIAETGDITGGETGGTGDSGSTGGSTASRTYSASTRSFSFGSSVRSSTASSVIAASFPFSLSRSSTSTQSSLSKASQSSSASSSRSTSTSSTSSNLSTASSLFSSLGSISSTSRISTSSTSRISTSSTSRISTSSTSRISTSSTSRISTSSTSRISTSSTSSTSSLLTGIGGDDGGTNGTDGGDTGNTTGGNTGGSSTTSTRSTSRSSTSSLTTLVGGACFGTECELGGDYFCGLFSEVCFQTPDFPCIECKAATSARSTRSSSSFAFSLVSYTSAPFISDASSPSDPNSVIPTDSPSLITASACSLDAPCGTNEFCVANECLSEQEVFLLPPFCGNARRDRGEQCDEGSLNSDRPNALCRPDCTIGRCGDTIRDTPLELCDDGNIDNNDGCSSLCQIERSAPTPTETLPATVIELPLTTIIAGVPSNQQNIPSPPKNSDTGPAALALMAAGAAAGYSYMKRKR